MSLTKNILLILKVFLTNWLQRVFLTRAKDITDSLPKGPVLIVAPHPDDETLGCAGITALLRSKRHPIKIIIVTDGSSADLPFQHKDLAAVRRKESLNAAQILGIPMEDVVFLTYKDGQAAQHVAQIANDIASQLWLTPPSLVLSPHGIDAHTDHQAVSAAIDQLVHEGKLSCTILEYPMWFWPKGGLKHLLNKRLLLQHRKIRVERFLGLKQQAIDAHQCQKNEANWLALVLYHIAGKLRPYELFFEKPRKPQK